MTSERSGNKVDDRISRTIKVARVVAIFFMTYSHAVRPTIDMAVLSGPLVWIEHVADAMEVIAARCSVPLLSVVSGWLLVVTFKGVVAQSVLAKARTLLVPLLLWNIVMAAVFTAAGLFTNVRTWEFIPNISEVAGDFLALSRYPVNIPLYFLKDIFICAMVGLLIMVLARTSGRAAYYLGLVGAIAFAVFAPYGFIMQKAVILPSYVTGMIIAQGRADILSRHFIPRWIFFCALLYVLAGFLFPQTQISDFSRIDLLRTPELVDRFALAICGWFVIRWITAGTIGQRLAAWEKYVFFVFCSHFVLFNIIAALLNRVLGGFDSPVVYFVFFAEPAMAFVIGKIGFDLLARFAPTILAVLNGGRVGQLGPKR